MRWVPWLLLAWLSLGSARASAHEFRPAVLSVRQTDAGRFQWSWQPAFDAQREPLADVKPRFPAHCTVRFGGESTAESAPHEATRGLVDCRGRGLGWVEITGLRRHPVDVVVRAHWSDDRRRTIVLHGPRDRAELGDGGEGQPRLALASTYARLGVEHILAGADHVLFVLGLLLLVGWRRRLLATITGFTLAHSLTLAASTMGWATLPAAPAEVCIALSIVLLATELLHERPTLTRRFPGLIALAFGLLHGFGFAGALRQIGVPADQTPLALLGFNLGVEAGQLGIIALAGAVGGLVRQPAHRARWRTIAAYAGGTIATGWTIERVIALMTSS